jgi:cysteine synthase
MLDEPSIQQTPLTAMTAFGENLYAKLEFVHPTRSAKYRALAPHLYTLARTGELAGIEKLVIRSAGCAAVTTAWLCRRLAIPMEAVLPRHLEEDVAGVLKRLGATVTQLEPDQAARYMLEMEGAPHTYILDQFRDPRIVDYYRPLAGEILKEQPQVSAIVVGIGTAASIMGVAHEVRARQSACRVIGVWPAEFDPTWSEPYQPHGISGLAPPVRETHLDRSWINDIVMVPSADARWRSRQIFDRAGLSVGTSSGATLDAALRLREAGVQGAMVCIFASTFDCHLPEGL